MTYTRNANGQVSGASAVVAGSPVVLASGITYLPFGPLTALSYGNGRTFAATYDQDYNPTNRTVPTIYNYAYDTDDAGNIIQIGGTDYGYDALNRLDEEDAGTATTYTYDATSNRLTKAGGGTTTTTVPATSNKISAVGANSYTYDVAGNITNDGVNTYAWNAAGNLASVNTTAGVYTYNYTHQRTKKTAGGNTTHYVYGLNGLLYGEYDNAGTLLKEYVYLNDEPLAQVTAGSPEVLTYLHTDHLGTPRFGTNSGGSQVWAWDSDAFGVGAPSGAATVNLRMPGQYFDAESGLFYNWNRYYNPAIGRYISSDPIGLEGGLNTFNYVEQSPLMYTDPEGLIAGVDDVCIATAVGATIVAGILVTEYTKHCITPEKPASVCPQNWINNSDAANDNERPRSSWDGVWKDVEGTKELPQSTPPNDEQYCKAVRENCRATCSETLPTQDYGFAFWNCVNKCVKEKGC